MMRSILLFALLLATGCTGESLPRLRYLPDKPQPAPIAHIPHRVRFQNWEGRSQYGQGGSCVHASSMNAFAGIGREDLVNVWLKNRSRGYEGPETGNGILAKYKEQGIPHLWTETADASLLEAASETHRPGIIFYFPSHCVTFIEFAEHQGKQVAVLLDNNFPDEYFFIDRDLFDRSWRYYDGFAAVPWLEPITPRTYPRTVPERS